MTAHRELSRELGGDAGYHDGGSLEWAEGEDEERELRERVVRLGDGATRGVDHSRASDRDGARPGHSRADRRGLPSTPRTRGSTPEAHRSPADRRRGARRRRSRARARLRDCARRRIDARVEGAPKWPRKRFSCASGRRRSIPRAARVSLPVAGCPAARGHLEAAAGAAPRGARSRPASQTRRERRPAARRRGSRRRRRAGRIASGTGRSGRQLLERASRVFPRRAVSRSSTRASACARCPAITTRSPVASPDSRTDG
jgi:hypothetical protein